MADADVKAQVKESAEAAECFAAYVAMGVNRSLRGLAQTLVGQKLYKNPGSALTVLSRWSAQHAWQARIAAAATARSEALLNEAAELDADTFLRTSRHLQRQVDHYGDIPDTTIKIRESVRRAALKGGISVTGGDGAPLTIQIVERTDGPR